MEQFTPYAATAGGALIGFAAVLLMALNGRIAGVSGIFWGALAGPGDRPWRLGFVAGLVLAPLAWSTVADPVPFSLAASLPMVVVGGLLVGIGTRLGAGCTSGHGVCGLARLSRRSLVAVLTFMATGIVSAGVVHRLIGWGG